MITATIIHNGKMLATWTEAEGYSGDPLFRVVVETQSLDPAAYYPLPGLAAFEQAAAETGLEVFIEGEPDPLPDGALG